MAKGRKNTGCIFSHAKFWTRTNHDLTSFSESFEVKLCFNGKIYPKLSSFTLESKTIRNVRRLVFFVSRVTMSCYYIMNFSFSITCPSTNCAKRKAQSVLKRSDEVPGGDRRGSKWSKNDDKHQNAFCLANVHDTFQTLEFVRRTESKGPSAVCNVSSLDN